MDRRANLRIVTLPLAGVLCATATPSGDERMILAHEAFVVTFDASTVAVASSQCRARMHIYLPAPVIESGLQGVRD